MTRMTRLRISSNARLKRGRVLLPSLRLPPPSSQLVLQRSRKGELVANQGPELRVHLGERQSYDADDDLEPGDDGGVEPGGGTTRDEDLIMELIHKEVGGLNPSWNSSFVNCSPRPHLNLFTLF